MLPSLSALARRRRLPPRATAALGGMLLLGAAALFGPASSDAGAIRTATIADTLAPDTWALSLPGTWLATFPVGLRPGDRLDVLALRSGDHASATAIAFDLLVVSVNEHALVVGCRADDATALAIARASGMLLVPLLRSSR